MSENAGLTQEQKDSVAALYKKFNKDSVLLFIRYVVLFVISVSFIVLVNHLYVNAQSFLWVAGALNGIFIGHHITKAYENLYIGLTKEIKNILKA